jgi:hypothetical protein
MAFRIDYKQISETNFKVLKAILEDDNITIDGITQTIKAVFNKDTISELVYMLIEHNKELCNEIEGWDLKAIGSK